MVGFEKIPKLRKCNDKLQGFEYICFMKFLDIVQNLSQVNKVISQYKVSARNDPSKIESVDELVEATPLSHYYSPY